MTDKEISDIIGWRKLQIIREGGTLKGARGVVGKIIRFCERSGVAAVNIEKALNEFLIEDKKIKERYENNTKESHAAVLRTRLEADNNQGQN